MDFLGKGLELTEAKHL